MASLGVIDLAAIQSVNRTPELIELLKKRIQEAEEEKGWMQVEQPSEQPSCPSEASEPQKHKYYKVVEGKCFDLQNNPITDKQAKKLRQKERDERASTEQKCVVEAKGAGDAKGAMAFAALGEGFGHQHFCI